MKQPRRLAYLAVGLTFALVIVGGVVRISDSGLGCGAEGAGTDGWPLCGGRVVPLIDTNMIIEYSHRILAGTLAIVIGLIAYNVRRHHREDRGLVRVSTAAFGLVLFQAALGGATVEKGLKEELVAAHLGIAMIQIGLLILIAYMARSGDRRPAAVPGRDSSLVAPTPRGIRLLAIGATTAVLATIVAGGYMSASELHGTPERGPDVHTACGTDFPRCAGEFMPFGRSREVDIHLTHRALMYLASFLVLALFAAVMWRRRRGGDPMLVRAAGLTVLVLATQVFLGALNVWVGEREWLIVAHLTVGTLLWCSLVLVSLLAVSQAQPSASRARRDSGMQAVPA